MFSGIRKRDVIGSDQPAPFVAHPRIPSGAEPWNSDYLLPGERFSVMLTVSGVYYFFCIPHEMAV